MGRTVYLDGRAWVVVPDRTLAEIHILLLLSHVTLGFLFTLSCHIYKNEFM